MEPVGEVLRKPHEARGLHPVLRRLGRAPQLASEEERGCQRRDQRREELPGGPAHGECPLGMSDRLVEAVHVHLRRREMRGRVDAPGQLGVRHRADQL